MNRLMITTLRIISLLLVTGLSYTLTQAQGVDDPLTIQRMDNSVVASVRGRAMGSAVTAVGIDATTLFYNPASLVRIPSLDIRVGAGTLTTLYEQTQEWHPNKYYAELSLLFENRQDGIKNPGIKHYDTTWNTSGTIKRLPFDSVVTLVHAYDTFGPNSSNRINRSFPGYAAAAIPLTLGPVKLAAGVGYAEALDLNHYFQNNNALRDSLHRYIGAWRPIYVPMLSGDTLNVNWFQYVNQRSGSVYGTTPSLAIGLGENFSVGVSGTILTGTTDDREETVGRGLLHFLYANKVTNDSVDYHLTKIGTSTYSGTKLTIGLLFYQPTYSVGVSIHPSYTLQRDWNRTVTVHKNSSDSSYQESGSDKLTFPMTYTIGIGIYPTENITIAADYEVRAYSTAAYQAQTDTVSQNPWLDSQMFKVGMEYKATNWLTLRGGYREDVQSFAEVGTGLLTEPIRGSVYSFGCGITWRKIQLSIAYEYSYTRYIDAWESNINYNTREGQTVVAEIGYQF